MPQSLARQSRRPIECAIPALHSAVVSVLLFTGLFAGLFAGSAAAASPAGPIDRPDTVGMTGNGGYRDDDAGDAVDFGEKPRTGTAIDVEDRLECRVRGTIRYEGEDEPRRVNKRADGEARLRQTFERVDTRGAGGRRGVRRVSVDHRRYRMTITQFDDAGEATTQPPIVHPLEGRTVRARWPGRSGAPERVRIEIASEDGWLVPSVEQRRMIRPGQLVEPLLPMPSTIKRVGESWSLTQPQLDDVFADHFGRVASVAVAGRSRLTLTRVRRVGGRRIADIALDFDVRLSVPGHPTSRLRLSGTARYDATDGFVAAVDMQGTTKTAGRLEANGQIVTLDVESEMRIESRASIVRDAAIPTGDR